MCYTRDFLIAAYLWRYRNYPENTARLRDIAEKCYDKHGKEKFRVYASLNAKFLKEYKEGII